MLNEIGFEFTGHDGKPYLCRMNGDQPWFYYKHPDGQWVTLRAVTQMEVWLASALREGKRNDEKWNNRRWADMEAAKERKTANPSTPTACPRETVYRFVKASKRRPENGHYGEIALRLRTSKIIGGKYINYRFCGWTDIYGYVPLEIKIDDIEWQEEIPSSAPQKESEDMQDGFKSFEGSANDALSAAYKQIAELTNERDAFRKTVSDLRTNKGPGLVDATDIFIEMDRLLAKYTNKEEGHGPRS